MFLASCSGGGAEGRKPRRSRIVPHACRIRSALPAADISVRGVLGMIGALSLVCGMVEGLGGVRPEDKMGSDDPVKREAAVAAATTLEKKRRGLKRISYRTNKIYLRSVPKTSILLDEIDGVWLLWFVGNSDESSRGGGGSSSASAGSLVNGVDVSNTSGSTLDDKGKSESAAGGVMVTEGTESLMVDGGREDTDRGRRSAESLFLARLVPDSAVVSDVAGTGRSVEVEVEFESVP